ncbi:TPA: hypothetical protein JG821_004645 [Vibrio parahaemolyticus]|uniref:hypothetical protein n=1 Tax=Vibrio parahaemolyticus TaxID=670 RepID=UPI001121507C|nr:hypothetical protein [Vibrio parahaemolyticus]ELB2184801.1 hypothetical protein [Vibrio parahaemolyticus]MBE4422423.1 hypothetical protein [Vibrio parahaemolyticus]TOJ09282.1 hypothetical protein CGI45_24735 [Vibrio parahaemolyticus]HAS6868443.1 hypothetical protein [Vibrio parahaemolyticus]HAV1516339.1 hypothetical protein [Vibrio parahaemolyticus]
MKVKLIFIVLMSFSARSQEVVANLEETGLPKEIIHLLDRISMCNHWAGEYAYDAERRTQIEQGITESNCISLPKDIEVMRTKYNSDVKVINTLDRHPVVY